MTKSIKFLFLATIVMVATVSMFTSTGTAQAQTASVACPVGYTCTLLPACPVGYTCVPATQPAGCPYGYFCTVTSPNNGGGSGGGGGVGTTVPVGNCYVFSINLSLGSTGVDVVALQTWLISNGYNIPAIASGQQAKGYFGIQTQSALMRYQIANGLNVSGVGYDKELGYFGPMTRQKVNDSCTTTVQTGVTVSSAYSGFSAVQGQSGVMSGSFSFTFTVNNNLNSGIYLSKSANSKGGSVELSTQNGPASIIPQNVSMSPSTLSGDTTSAFYIPAGTSRILMINGWVDNTNGVPGMKDISVSGLSYSMNSSLYPFVTMNKELSGVAGLSLAFTMIGNGTGTTQSSITVVSPNGGEMWQQGTTHNITWQGQYLPPNSQVRIDLRGWSYPLPTQTIAPAVNAGSQFYSWIIPSSLPLGDYRVEIYQLDANGQITDASAKAISQNSFTITSGTTQQPTITVTSPTAGQSFITGQQVQVSYSTNNFPRPVNVALQLNKGAVYPNGPFNPVGLNTITNGYVSATGNYTWTIPPSLTPGTDYSIMVSSDYPSTETSNSNAGHSDNFSIVTTAQPTISLTATPNTLTQGQSTTVSWSTTGATRCSSQPPTGSYPPILPASWLTPATSGSFSFMYPNPITFTLYLSCTGPGGTATKSLTVPVTPAATTNYAHSITASAGTGGYISPMGAIPVGYGASQTFTITPYSGYRLSSVMVDGVSTNAVSPLVLSNVVSNHTITAAFTMIDTQNPTIVSFTLTPTSVVRGQSATLSWTTTGGITSCTIDTMGNYIFDSYLGVVYGPSGSVTATVPTSIGRNLPGYSIPVSVELGCYTGPNLTGTYVPKTISFNIPPPASVTSLAPTVDAAAAVLEAVKAYWASIGR